MLLFLSSLLVWQEVLTRFLCIFLFEGKFEFVQLGFGVPTMLQEIIPSSFVSLNPLLCSSIFSCSSIHLLCGLLFNIAVPFIHQEGLKCLYYKKKSHLLILLSSNFFLIFVLEAIAVPGVRSGQEFLLYILKKNH